MTEPVLAVRDLTAHYGDFQALFGVDLTLSKGQALAIIGANGAGKSTLMRAITGILPGPAEAVRLNPQYAPRLGPIGDRAAFAMAQVSGCRVTGVLGDQVVITGVLDCGGTGDRRVWLPVGYANYSCIEVSRWENEGPGPKYLEFDCDPY